MENKINNLVNKASSIGVNLSPDDASTLIKYADALIETNKLFNLTAITEYNDVENKHIVDSLTVTSFPEVRGNVADVGSGPGFPGAVIAAVRKDCNVTMIEATEKKMNFALKTCNSLGVKINGIHGRAEELSRQEYRERFDTVTARAVANMASLSEYCLPLLKVGGYFIAMKGPEAEQELAEAKRAIGILGGEIHTTVKLKLPDDSERSIVIIRKISHTPDKYPRSGKNIRKAHI